MLSSGADGNGLSPSDQHYCRSEISCRKKRASHFQNLMMVPERKKILLAKFTALYLSGISSLVLLLLCCDWGGNEPDRNDPLEVADATVLGLAMNSLVIYALHLFFSLKFGLGLSVFLGVFECLQCILYSNIELHGL